MQKAYIVQNEEDFQNLMETIEIFERDDSKNSFLENIFNTRKKDRKESISDLNTNLVDRNIYKNWQLNDLLTSN